MRTGGFWHFTQMAWAESSEIGCGYALFEEQDKYRKWKPKEIVVCNYMQAGNFIGRPVYKTGSKACSHCKGGKTCNDYYPSL